MDFYNARYGIPKSKLPFVRYTKSWLKASKLGEIVKMAVQLAQFDTVPLSPHTAIADYIKNRKYKPEPNEFTSDDQALIQRLLAGMSKSRARVVDATRRARNTPQLLRQHFQSAGLWG